MFGLAFKISDSSLYLIPDMVESMLETAEYNLANTSKEKTEEIEGLQLRIAYYKQEIREFKEHITKQCEQSFQFSVEELYYMYGQYDKYIEIEFHKFSETAKKYGRNIGGIFVYGQKERKNLEATVNSDNIQRTNGLVKINVSSSPNLTDEHVKELSKVGFYSGDIYEISKTNTALVNQYIQEGRKEIPNTINININTRETDLCKLVLYNLNLRLKDGRTLIKSEWNQYCGFNLYYSSEISNDEFLKDKIFNADGSKNREVRFYELIAKFRNSDITNEELKEFSALLIKRRIERFEILKNELKKTGINSLEKFQIDYPKIYKEIYDAALIFEDDVLVYTRSSIPVYWDFKSYLHIYLRHCDELQPTGEFKSKTPFAYKQKDIRRILSIAIEQLDDKIQARLSQGLDFRTFGEKALYFNGDFYFMRIESNGRIDSFHPYGHI